MLISAVHVASGDAANWFTNKLHVGINAVTKFKAVLAWWNQTAILIPYIDIWVSYFDNYVFLEPKE